MDCAEPSPRQIDLALEASLPPSVASGFQARWVDYGTERTGWDGRVVAYERTIRDLDPGELAEATELVTQCCTPAAPNLIRAEIARLLQSVAMRPRDELDLGMTAQVRAEALAAFPADIVIATCRKLGRSEKFLPTVSEIVELANRESCRRQALLLALNRAAQEELKALSASG